MKLLQISKIFKQMDNREMFMIKMFECTFLKLLAIPIATLRLATIKKKQLTFLLVLYFDGLI